VLPRLLRGQRRAVPSDDHGDLELEVEQPAAGRHRHVCVGADERVRVGEVERRCLVPLRDHAGVAGHAAYHAFDVFLERDEVPHGRRGERR